VDTTQVASSAAVVQRTVVVFTGEVWVRVEGAINSAHCTKSNSRVHSTGVGNRQHATNRSVSHDQTLA